LAAGDRAAAAQALHRACNLLNRNANAYHAAETLRLQGELLLLNGEPGEARARFEAAALQASAQGNLALQQRAMRSMARTA
jgi:predicted negative regulator of RcsB-dependent stress response